MQVDLTQIFVALTTDLGIEPKTVKYCLHRIHYEGSSFLTLTLPSFGDTLLKSLEMGSLQKNTAFRCRKRFPLIFRGLLLQIFSPSGEILDDPSPDAVASILACCWYFKKLALSSNASEAEDDSPTSYKGNNGHRRHTKMVAEAVDKFISTDKSLSFDKDFADKMRVNFLNHYPRMRSTTIDELLNSHRPRAGSGTYSGQTPAPADIRDEARKLAQQSRFTSTHSVSYSHIERFSEGFPHSYRSHAKFHGAALKHYPGSKCVNPPLIDGKPSDYESELLLVPKSSKGPRTIVREPYQTLRMQMAFFDFATTSLESDTKGRINFISQEISRNLALAGSIDSSQATIDLSSASDTVSFALALQVFRQAPAIRWFLLNCRTSRVVVDPALIPGYSGPRTSIFLKKLAGMGSGLTFPVMSLIIHLAICTHISAVYRLPYEQIMSQVYTYGDDIILPSKYTDCAYDALHLVGMKPNSSKSFSKGHFRESCGLYAFRGVEVTPLHLKLASSLLPFPDPPRYRTCRYTKKGIPSCIIHVDPDRVNDTIVGISKHMSLLVDRGWTTLHSLYRNVLENHFGYPLAPSLTDNQIGLGGLSETVLADKVIPGCLVPPSGRTFISHPRFGILPPQEEGDQPGNFIAFPAVEEKLIPTYRVVSSVKHRSMSPEAHLGRILRKRRNWSSNLGLDERPPAYGTAPVPRGPVKITTSRVDLSLFCGTSD